MPITQGRDVIAQAQSGTGKTATFSISILQSIDINVRETQALVLSPTRELATQIQAVCVTVTLASLCACVPAHGNFVAGSADRTNHS